MTPAKRRFDVGLAVALVLLLAPIIAVIAVVILLRDGRPVFYVSERMRDVDRPFQLWKFRTMRNASDDAIASGGHKTDRITATGRVLRRTRLDELPQLWNILRGDMSFVGPRPPLRRYVELQPVLYGKVLRNRPGVTGLATLLYHKEEDRILARCQSAEETDRIYAARCVPRKAEIDLVYGRNWSLCLDVRLIVATVLRRLPPVPGHAPMPR